MALLMASFFSSSASVPSPPDGDFMADRAVRADVGRSRADDDVPSCFSRASFFMARSLSLCSRRYF